MEENWMTEEVDVWERLAALEVALDEAMKELKVVHREFDILEDACDFWYDTAIELGYEE